MKITNSDQKERISLEFMHKNSWRIPALWLAWSLGVYWRVQCCIYWMEKGMAKEFAKEKAKKTTKKEWKLIYAKYLRDKLEQPVKDTMPPPMRETTITSEKVCSNLLGLVNEVSDSHRLYESFIDSRKAFYGYTEKAGNLEQDYQARIKLIMDKFEPGFAAEAYNKDALFHALVKTLALNPKADPYGVLQELIQDRLQLLELLHKYMAYYGPLKLSDEQN